MNKDMVKVVFFVGLRRSRARVGTGGVESDDRGITRELVSPSLGETESWIGVVQFVQSQLRDVGLSDSDTYSLLYARTITHTGRSDARGERRGAQRGGPERLRGAQWRGPTRSCGPRIIALCVEWRPVERRPVQARHFRPVRLHPVRLQSTRG